MSLKLKSKADLRNDNSREERFTIVEPFVMAYRVNELKMVSREIFLNKPYTEGAALGTIGDAQGRELELFVEGIAKTDFEGGDAAKLYEDDSGHMCRYAHPD